MSSRKGETFSFPFLNLQDIGDKKEYAEVVRTEDSKGNDGEEEEENCSDNNDDDDDDKKKEEENTKIRSIQRRGNNWRKLR